MTQEQIEELRIAISEVLIPYEWRAESVAQAITEVFVDFDGGQWAVASTQDLPRCLCPADTDYPVFRHSQRDAIARYIAAANPAAVLELIAEVERLREDADDLTIALESSEKALNDSRANDYTAMGYLADCRVAVGDNGKRMLPEFVEYLRQLKQQRDELLAALELFMERVDEPPEANCSCHISPPCNDCVENWGLREAFSDAKEAIAKAEG